MKKFLITTLLTSLALLSCGEANASDTAPSEALYRGTYTETYQAAQCPADYVNDAVFQIMLREDEYTPGRQIAALKLFQPDEWAAYFGWGFVPDTEGVFSADKVYPDEGNGEAFERLTGRMLVDTFVADHVAVVGDCFVTSRMEGVRVYE